ncbi:MAG TPA: hypothetical protein VG227_09555 [Caulobacteraceae bacterium]|jgi:hypothetical protein|nr:hypothetical protein [Caulobacteraceae bacterium]
MTTRAQTDQQADLEVITVDPETIPVDQVDPAEARRGTSIRGVFSVAVSLAGLAFVVWIMFAHPKYPNLFGPPPGTHVVASAAHVPPPRPIPG